MSLPSYPAQEQGLVVNTIKIGNEEFPLSDVDPQWITQQIVNRRKDGLTVCVIITITSTDLDLRLSTPTCGGGGGGGRQATSRERGILDLWNQHHLGEMEFSPGDVVAFVKQVQRMI